MINTIINLFLGFFNNTKTIVLTLFSLLIGAYVLKQKYDKNKAVNKLNKMENNLYKENIKNIKDNYKTNNKINILKNDIDNKIKIKHFENKQKIKNEIKNIENKINKSKEKIKNINNQKRIIKRKKITKKIDIEV